MQVISVVLERKFVQQLRAGGQHRRINVHVFSVARTSRRRTSVGRHCHRQLRRDMPLVWRLKIDENIFLVYILAMLIRFSVV
jgi:hypothetical protein